MQIAGGQNKATGMLCIAWYYWSVILFASKHFHGCLHVHNSGSVTAKF